MTRPNFGPELSFFTLHDMYNPPFYNLAACGPFFWLQAEFFGDSPFARESGIALYLMALHGISCHCNVDGKM